MNFHSRVLCFLSIPIVFSSYSDAKLLIGGDNAFKKNVSNYLAEASRNSNRLSKLIAYAKNSPKTIRINPITNDPATWHTSGEKSRSHTEAIDNKKRGHERRMPTDAVVFINVNRIDPNHKSYKNGTLIHELAHAVDLANGKYNGDYKIREKRAVFFENIWRHFNGKKLRTDYHGRFPTTEYQEAIANRTIDKFVRFYFADSGIP